MDVIAIDDIKKFESLKTNWDKIYTADKQATVFVSWDFLRGLIAVERYKWKVLAVRSNTLKDYVAFLFLFEDKNGQMLSMCDKSVTDHTSFICKQGYEKESIQALAKFVQKKMNWQQLKLHEVMDSRINLFLKSFSTMKYRVRELENTACPCISLGKTWDGYLLERLSQKSRKKLRKYLRDFKKEDKLFITKINPNNSENHIEIVLRLWQKRWGKLEAETSRLWRSIFRYCFENNHLFLPVLWFDNKPIAASVAFVDHSKRCIYDYIGGWDDTYKNLSPGNTLNAFCVQYAIENKFEKYDFLRGEEAYKYSTFGSVNRYNRNIRIEKKSLRPLIKSLNIRLRCAISRVVDIIRTEHYPVWESARDSAMETTLKIKADRGSS